MNASFQADASSPFVAQAVRVGRRRARYRPPSADSWWRSGNPAERTGILANGQTGLCNHSGGPCTITPGESTGRQIVGNRCDKYPYSG